MSLQASDELAVSYDTALLDLDGVVYVGERAVDGAAEALAAARERGMRLAFVTNNASRPPAVVAAHLTELGVPAQPSEVVTSAQAAVRLLAERLPAGSRVLVVGGAGLEDALAERGLQAVWSADDKPHAVVQGFSPDVGWRALAEGAVAVSHGLLWVATNMDRTIPTARGRAPGNGVLVDAIRAATGVAPLVAGKPEPPLHRESVERTGARRPLVVGDRLDTDIEGAHRVGCPSLLVLTGVTQVVELLCASPEHRPSFVGRDLRALLGRHPAPSHTGSRWSCGAASATVTDGRLEVSDVEPDPLDALRAACAAAWAARDAPEGGGRERLDVDDATRAIEEALAAVPSRPATAAT